MTKILLSDKILIFIGLFILGFYVFYILKHEENILDEDDASVQEDIESKKDV